MELSRAVTVNAMAVPAVADDGALTAKWVAVPLVTLTVALPVKPVERISATDSVCEPVVLKVTALLKVCVPASVEVKV